MEARKVEKIRQSFPFSPYQGQVEYAEALHQIMTEGKVGVFESPTGTVCFALIRGKAWQ